MAENTDIAVLGFRVRTAGADAAFKKILESLGTVESKFKETDKLLEAQVTKSMKDLGAGVRGVNAAANALNRNKGLFDAFDSLKTFATEAKNLKVDAKAIKEALEIMSNSRLTSMAKRLGDAFSTFERGTKVLEFEMKLANPDFLEQLQKDLLITIEPTTKAALSELKYSLDALAKGVIAKIIPSQDSLKELKQAVQDGIQPEIKFDENAKGIVANLYSVIRDGIKQQGPILVPLQFTFGKPKSDRTGTNLSDPEKQARDDLRATLEEYAKDFGGKGGLNAVWDKAILGGPEAIEKIRRVLATRTSWLETAITDSLNKAQLKPSKYGELVEQGLESIPVDVANTVGKIAGQLKGLLKRHQEEFTFRPEIGTATQSEDDIKGVIDAFIAHVKELMPKKPIELPGIMIKPSSIQLDRKALANVEKGSFDSFTLPIKHVSVFPKTISVVPETANIDPVKTMDVEVAKLNARPRQVAINLNDVAKEAFKITAGRVALTPESIKLNLPKAIQEMSILRLDKPLGVSAEIVVTPTKITIDLPPGIKNQSILRITKPVIASADVLISPTSFAFKQGALNKIQASIGQTLDVQGYIAGINQVQTAIKQLIPFATTLASQLAAIHNNLSGGLAQLLTKKNVNAVNAMNNNIQAKQANQQKQQQALANINHMLKQPFSKTTIDNIRQTHEKAFDGLVQSLNKKGQVVHDVETGVISDIANATSTTTANIANADAALQANTKILQQNAKTLRSNAAASRQVTMDTARMAASVVGVNTPLRQMHLTIQDLEQVTLLNLEDPFKKMKAAIGDTGSRIADIGRMMGIYFSGRTIINFFKEAAESANAFGMEIRRIQSLATDFDFSNLRNELMDIDARFGSVTHNAQALYWAYSSGVRGSEKELANFVETMSKTATSIKADVMPTVDAATSIMNAWNLSASSAAEIGDLLFSIVKYGKSNAQQLTTSLGHVVAPAAALNIEMNELGAAAATLTKTMKTNRAFTYLSNILGKMASPTKQVQEAAAELGIELSASAIKARGFANTLADIRKATGGDIAKIAKLFPDLRGQRAAITLLSTQYKDFEQQLENMRGKAGKMEEALSKIADTPESQLRALRNTISMISIGAGDAVNNVLTLGGALGPVLKIINGLEHGGREILGHLVAAAGATAGIAISMKAIAAAQYASAKSAYDMAVAESETKRNALDVALSLERQAMEANKLAVADTNAQIAARLLNNEELKRLQIRKEILDTSIREGRNDVENAREALKMDDMITKRRYEDMATGIGQSTSRLAMLRGLKVNETTGQVAHDMERDLAILERLQMTITAESAKLDGQQTTFLTKAHKAIENYVLANKNLNTQLNTAITKTNVDNYKKYTELINTVVSKIKGTSIIAGEMNQILNGEEILKMAAKEFAVADLRKRMTEGTAFSHKVIVRLLDEEISKENHHLETLKAELNTQLQADKVNADRRAQVDAIAMSEATVAKLEQTRSEVIADIETRTKDLVQREQEYARILKENVNLTKSKLDADTRNVETLKKNLDANLRQAAVIGKDTLSAVRATSEAQLNYRAALIESRAVQADILRITDADGKLIVNSVDNQQKLLELQQKKVDLMKIAVDERKRFIALGVRSGDIDARNMRIEELKANGASMSRIVKGIARDKGVVGEAVKQMSSVVGQGVFGGMLGGRGAMGLSIASSLIPGMGKWGMTASMLTGFDIFGKAASGMTRLTAGTLKLLGTTEKLQKRGIMGLEKGIEDLTKTLMTGVLWTKRQSLANQALQALGGDSAGMAAWATKATWMTAGLGIAGILGGAIVTGLLMYFKTEKGGPLGDLAEAMFGLDRLKRENDFLDARREWMKASASENDEMLRNMKRMRESFAGNQININGLKANLTNVQNVVSGQIVDGTAALLSAQNTFVNDMSADLSKIKYDIGALKLKQKHLKKNLDDAYSQIGINQANLNKKRNNALYTIYYSAIEYGMRNPEAFFKFGFDEKLWNKALKNATFDPKVLFATPASSFSKQQQKGFATILSDHDKWFDFIPLLSVPYKFYEAYEDELAKNKSQIKQLQDEARRLNNIAHGKGMSKQMAETINSAMTPIPQDVINSSVDAERKLYAALNGIGKVIQAESAFELHVYEMQQKEMQRINEAISKLELHGRWKKYETLMPEAQAKLSSMQAMFKSMIEQYARLATTSDRYLVDGATLDEMKRNIQKLQQDIVHQQKFVDDLARDSETYNQWLEGMAEFRYQIVRESMENDLSSAMAPMRDSTERLELAKKMTERSFNNMSFVLGRGGELADLTGKTTADIQEMVRQINNDLAMPMQRAKDEYDQLNIGLKKLKDGTEAYNEQSKLLKDAESKMNEVSKEYNDKIDAIRTASQNLYTNQIGEVTAFVDNALEIVKDRDFRAKYMSLFSNVDESFRTRTEDLKYLEETMKQLDEQYNTMTDAFAGMDPETARKAHRGAKRKLGNAIMQARINYINDLKSTSQSVAGFMENIANDMMNQSKSLFEFRMGDQAYAGMRPALIKQRMGMLNSVLSGKNGLYAQINNALELAQKRRSAQDFSGAMQALEDAKKYGAQARGIEEDKLDLIKKQADTEREINSSMYQLANTLRGQFAATTQQSVAADSVEALRLMSRQFGESIAPPVSTSYQEQERKYREQRMAQDKIFYQNLMTAATTLQTKIGEASKNASTNSVAAKTMETAADKANSAADTFTKAVESSKTIFRVRRI